MNYLDILKRLPKVNLYVGIVLWLVATIFLVVPLFPYVWYRIDLTATDNEAETLSAPNEDDERDESGNTESPQPAAESSLPPFDPTLPTTNMLIIHGTGVNGEIHEGTNAKATLESGIWRVPEFGTPETDNLPTILAAHRFGYVYWSNDFRSKNTFFNLPTIGEGGTFEIIWNQRKYEYRIYRAEDATQIQDYDADVILYTCRMFSSPVRIFRYAKRIN